MCLIRLTNPFLSHSKYQPLLLLSHIIHNHLPSLSYKILTLIIPTFALVTSTTPYSYSLINTILPPRTDSLACRVHPRCGFQSPPPPTTSWFLHS